jgi:hypothetical protein
MTPGDYQSSNTSADIRAKLIIFICSGTNSQGGEIMVIGFVRKMVKLYFTVMYIIPIALAAIRVIQSITHEKKPEEIK